ncbi:MAG: DUF892 family protein [Erythrobacter sp.]
MTVQTLKDLYIEQLQDIYSANSQSLEVTRKLRDSATSKSLTNALDAGATGIADGMDKVKQLILDHGAKPDGEFCKGMEGIVKEAKAHAINADFTDDEVRDAAIIPQYQRMVHYALAGYGTVTAFARRLKLTDDEKVLRSCLDDTYDGDRTMTAIASGEVNEAALQAA